MVDRCCESNGPRGVGEGKEMGKFVVGPAEAVVVCMVRGYYLDASKMVAVGYVVADVKDGCLICEVLVRACNPIIRNVFRVAEIVVEEEAVGNETKAYEDSCNDDVSLGDMVSIFGSFKFKEDERTNDNDWEESEEKDAYL